MAVIESRCKATCTREFKFPWRKAGPLRSSHSLAVTMTSRKESFRRVRRRERGALRSDSPFRKSKSNAYRHTCSEDRDN